MNEVIPFGKYKGQPIEVLQSDQQYLNWLTTQDWFREKYTQLNNVIINNFSESTETPEHNKLQVKFLDDEFLMEFFATHFKDCVLTRLAKAGLLSFSTVFEEKGIDVLLHVRPEDSLKEYAHGIEVSAEEEAQGEIKKMGYLSISDDRYHRSRLEKEYLEKKINDSTDYPRTILEDALHAYGSFLIELKPHISDDYPAVLRQVRNLMVRMERDKYHNYQPLVICNSFSSEGATLGQVKKIFNKSGITFICLSET